MGRPRAPMMADQKSKVQEGGVEVPHDLPDHPAQVPSLQAPFEVEEYLLAHKAGHKLAQKKSSYEETLPEDLPFKIT